MKVNTFDSFITFVTGLKGHYNSIDAKVLLTAYYEQTFGVFNHFNPELNRTRPLASVALFEEEDINSGSYLEDVIEIYITSKIKEYFGLTLIEYLELPRDQITILIEISGKKIALEAKHTQANIDALKNK